MLDALRSFFWNAWQNFCHHRPFETAAALAFYSLFSLAPLIIVIVAIAGLFFSDAEVQAALIARIRELIGAETATLVETIISNTTNEESNVLSLIVGGTLITIGATTAFAHLYSALNRIWNLGETDTSAMLKVLKGRLLSFAFLIVIGMMLVVSLGFSAALATSTEFLSRRLGIDTSFWNGLEIAISYGVTTLLVAVIYKYLPDTRVAWLDSMLGALVAALLFGLSKFLIRLYVAQMSPESSFGAAGSVVVFMLWIYCASLIVLVGAEVTRTFAGRHSL
jgi:membrane protein